MPDRTFFTGGGRGGSPSSPGPASVAPTGFTLAPQPRTGQGVYGAVPGNIGLPNPAGDLAKQFPGLGKTNAALSGDIYAGLEGQLSPGTLKDLQDYSAAWGVGSGMPGSGLQIHRTARDLGLTAEQLKNQAITQYNQTIPTISGTQTVNPALQSEIAQFNAINSAAPDPTAAGSHAEGLYSSYLNSLRSGGGGGGGIRPSGGGGFYSGNPSAGRAAADSMGEVVAYGPGGGGGGGFYSGNQAPTFAGSSSPGADPFMDTWNNDWDQSLPVTTGSDYSMFGDLTPSIGG